MRRRYFLAAGLAALASASLAHADELKEINFGVISTEASSNLKGIWEPFLADMQKGTGLKINGFYATDYAAVVEAMRFNKVQVAWFGNASAIQAVDRADGEVFVQSVAADGSPGYWSLLVVHKDSPLKSIDDVVKSPGKYTFGNGDPNSTSGFLIPSYYAWAKNSIDVRKHFSRVVTANHETNLLSVANKQVDLATNNTESLERLTKTNPEKAQLVREIWRSPLIPSDPLVWRKDLPAETKQKLKTFLLTYGVSGPDVDQAKKVLAGLQWAPFRASSNTQLLPVRQVAVYRDKLKLEADTVLSADDKAKRAAELDAKLAAISREMEMAGIKTN
jgi:phosphonate transport system substrate-binding protein